MRYRLLLLLFILCLSLSTRVSAQGGLALESINIELWAEFDQPSMLVINEFVVSPQTPLPAKITLRFPRDGNLIAVAYEANGQLVNTPFESPAEQGDWQTITLNVESYVPYRIEYYQAIDREGGKRSFSFQWFGDYPAESFNLRVQLPADSVNVNPSPALDALEFTPDGRHLIGMMTRSALKMGQSYQFKIEYERDSDALTDLSAANQVQPSEPINEDTPGRVSVDQIPWIIGLVGLAMIVSALLFYWRSLRRNTSLPAPTGRQRKLSNAGTADPSQASYCHECGTRSMPGDRFCRTCGSRLRDG